MTIQDIVRDWLKDQGYEGLSLIVGFDEGCGCELDDLMPCGQPSPDCEPGHKVECQCGEGCAWHIAPGPRRTWTQEEIDAAKEAGARRAEELAALSECAGPGSCHGALSWCDRCGNVRDVCDDPCCSQHVEQAAALCPMPESPEVTAAVETAKRLLAELKGKS